MSVTLTEAGLKAIAPGASAWSVAGLLQHQDLIARCGINTRPRLDHFLAQCAHETAGFTRLEENLFYTTARRLRAVWPARFKTEASAAPFLRDPRKLANAVYGGRLGNTDPDDGWRYRGSGCKMTLWRR